MDETQQHQDLETTPPSSIPNSPAEILSSSKHDLCTESSPVDENFSGGHQNHVISQHSTTDQLLANGGMSKMGQRHNCPSMTSSGQEIDHSSELLSHGNTAHRMRLQEDLGRLRTHDQRHQQEMFVSGWMSSDSPADFLPTGYTMEILQPQPHIPNETLRMAEAALLQNQRQDHTMSHHHGLPVMDSFSYHELTTAPPRPLPVRAMSTPHHMMMDQPAHAAQGLGVIRQPFFSG